MPLITKEQKQKDPNWYDHVKPGDWFHTGNPARCGICGCESDLWEIVLWMGIVPKLHLLCPGNEVNRDLHQRIDQKKDLLCQGALPASAARELRLEIIQMINHINAQVLTADTAA